MTNEEEKYPSHLEGVTWETINVDFTEKTCSVGKESVKNKDNYKEGKTPTYYTGKYKGIKVIDFIFDFELHHNLASCVEYIARAGKKDDERQDIQKAINHLEMYKEYLSLKDDIYILHNIFSIRKRHSR